MTAPLFEASHIAASWQGSPVIADVSFALDAGRIACLIGRSGSGKTTLFHVLAGLARPDAGQVLLDGADISGLPGHVGYMLQKDLLLDQRTIIDNVCLPRLIAGTGKKEARAEAAALLDSFGLAGCERKYPRQLSGGMRQRAALLRTYLMDARVMLMDEPFSALDALTRQDMQDWFLGMAGSLGLTGIVVTHDINEALMLADEVLVLGPASASGALPSTIIGRFALDCPREHRREFVLGEEAARLRHELLALLGDAVLG